MYLTKTSSTLFKFRSKSGNKIIKIETNNKFSIELILITQFKLFNRPKASEVLTAYLKQCNEPPWTSYFIKYSSIKSDQGGRSHFNWKVGNSNYHILRTGCFPYIKYHCTKRPRQDLMVEDAIMRIIKVITLGIPCLAYGIAATQLISHEEVVYTEKGTVTIYFLYEENKGFRY